MKKVVFITSRFPFPLDKGDKLRAYYQLREMSKTCDIHLISISREKINPEQLKELDKFCSSISIHSLSLFQSFIGLLWALLRGKPFQVGLFFNKKIKSRISKEIKAIEPHHIYCQLIRAAEYVKDEFSIPKTIDFMDVLSKGIERRIPSSPFYIKRILEIEAERLKVYEHIMFEYFDHHSIISAQDQGLIYHTSREKIEIIPNGIDTDFFSPNGSSKKEYDFLFNGNMQYQPNVTSAIYIAKSIMPLVWKSHPNATLLISGTSPTQEVKNLANDKIHISGWMDDIRNAYNSADIFIAPMQIGTGLQNKLLEAMAMQLPSVTSKLANNALKAVHNESILIGKNKEEYAKLMCELLENKTKRDQIGLKGKEYVFSHFNWESTTQKLMRIMDL
ncbi:MAG: glycosyltransferase [Flavobacteriales bacterium]